MRERWARRLAWITCSLVLVFTAAFAASYNAGTAPAGAEPMVPLPATPGEADTIAEGRAVYASLDCASCHSIAGEGSPRSPLDGVGSHLDRTGIRAWILGEESVAEELSPRALRAKQGYREQLEADRLEALVTYLSSLTE